MTVNRQKKVRKYRGSKTHGCGSKKKARGAGNRGGRGMAGTGKRAKQKVPGIRKEYGSYLGRFGFKTPQQFRHEVRAINIADLPQLEEVDLSALGYDKLLSEGTPRIKYKITVANCSKKAKDKIEKAGGQVVLKQDDAV